MRHRCLSLVLRPGSLCYCATYCTMNDVSSDSPSPEPACEEARGSLEFVGEWRGVEESALVEDTDGVYFHPDIAIHTPTNGLDAGGNPIRVRDRYIHIRSDV
ncbi:hypothetical protein FQN53_001723 [Emmonsiellopsis sp. PD_33]|nr:hypothetical protein FQN53_001723 [Emmonsiellopsis sp. PD_33]